MCTATEPRRILVIDDDLDIRDSLDAVLGAQGYQVVGAENGEEALRILENQPVPDLVLLDMMMPVMDGWAFMGRLRQNPGLQRIPVVVFSARRETEADARTIGADAALSKPVSLEDLLQTVQRYVPSASATSPAAPSAP